jgi:hypothetical protein
MYLDPDPDPEPLRIFKSTQRAGTPLLFLQPGKFFLSSCGRTPFLLLSN